jgi:uncharacterized membrane protein YedE/YeeE
MYTINIFTIEAIIIASVFGFIYGFLLQKADFCFVASFRDWISVRDTRVGKGLLVLISVTLLGTGFSLTFGLANTGQLWTVPIGFSNLLGGLLFGIGMTIAGSCATGALYRSGMGYVQFWIVIVCMMIGNVLFAYIYDPFVTSYIMNPQYMEEGTSLYSVIPLPAFLISIILVLMVLVPALIKFGVKGFYEGVKDSLSDFKRGQNPFKRSHWDIRFVGFVMGIVATIQFIILSPIGITGPETRIAGNIIAFFFGEEVVLSNSYFSNVMFAHYPFVGLGAEEFLVFSIIFGSFVAALLSKNFKLRFPKRNRLPYAIIGGLIMGVASRIAPGCNIANLVSGVGGLSIQSFIAVIGMALGIYVVTAHVFKMPLMLFEKNNFKV